MNEKGKLEWAIDDFGDLVCGAGIEDWEQPMLVVHIASLPSEHIPWFVDCIEGDKQQTVQIMSWEWAWNQKNGG